ncbi:MAG: DUF4390 domain-containing protein [Vicinamibacteria bacterium]
MARRLKAAAAALVCAILVPNRGGAEAAKIDELVPLVRSDGIFVSFRVSDVFNEDIERAIQTGLEVEFRYNVELKRPRGIWFDARVARREIAASVTYDNLTKRYKLTREIDGGIDATEVVADEEAMRRFMTTFESLRLFELSELAPNDSYYIRVKGVIRERNLLLLIPWDIGTDWKEARFDYVP